MVATQVHRAELAGGTAERILDAAEDLFAKKGYKGASLGEVAERVGIRSPSLYNHFRNKEALYRAVLGRLLDEFAAPMEELHAAPITDERLYQWLEAIVRKHHSNPNPRPPAAARGAVRWSRHQRPDRAVFPAHVPRR